MSERISLEEALAANTKAVIAHTEALNKFMAAAGKGGGAAAGASAGAASSGGGKKATTIDTIKTRFGAYLTTEDEDVRKTRVANVKKVTTKFDVKRVSELTADQWDAALKMLDGFEAAEKKKSEEDNDADGGGESLV